MSSPNKDLEKSIGLSTDQIGDVLRRGLLQFNARLPIGTPTVNAALGVQLSAPVEPSVTEFVVSLPAPAMRPMDIKPTATLSNETGGAAGDRKEIYITEGGVPVLYSFVAQPV